MRLIKIASEIGAELYNPHSLDVNIDIEDLAPLNLAKANHISFLANKKYHSKLSDSRAAAVIVGERFEPLAMIQLIHPHPQLAMAKAAQLFYEPTHHFKGQSELAFISESAKVASTATIFPFAYIGPHCEVGAHSILYPHVYLGPNCIIGQSCTIYPGANLMSGTQLGDDIIIHAGAVLGGDGFGFAPDRHKIEKIPQKGTVKIEDDVEIGPLSTIDRATFNQTIIRKGCKFDSQVHIGHNTDVGENTMLCGQVGVAGSTKIGRNCIAAGQVGVGPSLEFADGTIMGPKAGMTQSIKEPGEYLGMPGTPSKQWMKQTMSLRKLPDLIKKVQQLEKKLEQAIQNQAK